MNACVICNVKCISNVQYGMRVSYVTRISQKSASYDTLYELTMALTFENFCQITLNHTKMGDPALLRRLGGGGGDGGGVGMGDWNVGERE